MPEILKTHIDSFASLCVWHIIETEESLFTELHLSAAEEKEIRSLKLLKRRFEKLGCRSALSQLLNSYEEVSYSPNGAPKISTHYLSFAHTASYAAAAISVNYKIGVDIEKITPKIKTLYHKFLNSFEINHFDVSDEEQVHILWGAKEAAYKLYEVKNLDFAQQINIQEFSEGKGKGVIKTETEELSFQFFYQTVKDMMLVLAVG